MGPGDGRRRGWAVAVSAQDGVPAGASAFRGALLLAKPGIVAASLLAGYAGMALGAGGTPPAGAATAGLCALALAAAGAAALNGVLDAAPDRRMARLRPRSVALAALGERRVLAAGCAAVAAGIALAAALLNPLAAGLILAAVLSYALLYTLHLKRRSPFGVVPGGIPGALPVLAGCAATSGTVGPDAFALFALMLLWQPPHFWTLALAYRDDYRAGGVPVLPVVMGERYTLALIFLYATALVPAPLGLWLMGAASVSFAVFALLSGGAFLAACWLFTVRSSRPLLAFRASILHLAALLAGLTLDVCLSTAA